MSAFFSANVWSVDLQFLFKLMTQSLLFGPMLALLAPGTNLQTFLSTTAQLRPVSRASGCPRQPEFCQCSVVLSDEAS